jgi:hypothetical protein
MLPLELRGPVGGRVATELIAQTAILSSLLMVLLAHGVSELLGLRKTNYVR